MAEAGDSAKARAAEAQVYDLSVEDLSAKVTECDRVVAEAVYKNKRHLGSLGMVECALVIARELKL